MMQATLTLPGIAAIALTLGMAIDANVLINERVREELRSGMTPQMAIQAGYERAFGTILDSNVTTLIVGLMLLAFGSGPVRGFAVVHCLGILTSIFSAVVVSRGIVNLIYGGRKKAPKLSIGNVDWHRSDTTSPRKWRPRPWNSSASAAPSPSCATRWCSTSSRSWCSCSPWSSSPPRACTSPSSSPAAR